MPAINNLKKKMVMLIIIPCLLFLSFKTKKQKLTIYTIGDSTMATYGPRTLAKYGDTYPLRGWMQMMPDLFNNELNIRNMAVSGISSKTFRTKGYWKKVTDSIRSGDYVFIQFGHNDETRDTARHTDARTSFRQNFINYITEIKSYGAHPILFTSIARRDFDKNGKLVDTHGDYVKVVRELAMEMQLPLVDLNKKTADLIEQMGVEESKKLFLYVAPGIYKALPEGKKDDTHLCIYGAEKVARMAAEELKSLKLPIAKYLK